jgi:hypothetical protein
MRGHASVMQDVSIWFQCLGHLCWVKVFLVIFSFGLVYFEFIILYGKTSGSQRCQGHKYKIDFMINYFN